MSQRPDFNELFEPRLHFPDPVAKQRLDALVGLDEHKLRLTKMLSLLVNPKTLSDWAGKFHPGAESSAASVLRRPPLVVLAGDVGSGKSELAQTIGDAVARQLKADVTLLPLSLATRGQGRVGEMSQLLAAAFDYAIDEARKFKRPGGAATGAVLLLVDEADALAQSRESGQMHHEDRAGVNTFIRGVDRLAHADIPAAVITCTNRAAALDPAVKRRAAEILPFGRPDEAQRRAILEHRLAAFGLDSTVLTGLAKATGAAPGFTASDLTHRLVPAIILDAYPDNRVSGARALEVARSIIPTPPFQDGVAK